MSTSAALVSAGKKKIYTLADLTERKNEEPKKVQGKLGARIATLSDLPQSQAAKIFEQVRQSTKNAQDEAFETLREAESTLSQTKGTLTEVRGTLHLAEGTLNEAKGTLNEAKNTLNEAKDTLNEAKDTLGQVRETLDDTRSTLRSARAALDEAREVNRISEQSTAEALEMVQQLEALRIENSKQLVALLHKSKSDIARKDDEIRDLQILRDRVVLSRDAQAGIEGRVVSQPFDWCLWITIIALAAIVIIGAAFLLL